MSGLIEILKTILPIALVLGLGVHCRRREMLSREGIDAIKSVAVNIALPAVLLQAFATADYGPRSLVLPAVMFGVCCAAWALGHLARRVLRISSRFVPFLTTGFEAGMLGYTLYGMLYGQESMPHFALIDLGQVLFVFTLYKMLIRLDSRESVQWKTLLREMFTSPVVLAIFAGVLLGASGAYRALIPSGVSDIFDACTDFVSASTSTLILLSIGYDLVFSEIRWRETGKVVAARTVILLALMGGTLLLLRALGLSERALTGAVAVMFILPPPFVLPVFATDEAQRTYISSALSLSTLVSLGLFALLTVLVL